VVRIITSTHAKHGLVVLVVAPAVIAALDPATAAQVARMVTAKKVRKT
jgi:hypothetical protein